MSEILLLALVKRTATDRFRSIDALRGMAAIMVLVLHVGQSYINHPRVAASGRGLLRFYEYVDLGRIGICIFFIISGFVICRSFNSDRRELKSFVVKRFFRLYPLFWFSMILAGLVLWPKHASSLTPGIIGANATMLPSLLGQPFMIGLYWTLETELLFYVLMSLLYWLGLLGRPKVMLALTLLMYVLLSGLYFLPMAEQLMPHWKATPYHLSLMMLGVTTRYAYDAEGSTRKPWLRILSTHAVLLALVPLVILVLYLVTGQAAELPDAIAYLLGMLMFFVGLRYLRSAPGWMTYLGVITYSIYLLHPVVFTFVRQLLVRYDLLLGLHISVYIVLCGLLTVLLSAISYKYLEASANRVGRRCGRAAKS